MNSLWMHIDQCYMNCKNFRWKKKCLCASFMKLCPFMVWLKRMKTTSTLRIIVQELNSPIMKSTQMMKNNKDNYGWTQITYSIKRKNSRVIQLNPKVPENKSSIVFLPRQQPKQNNFKSA